MEVTHPMDIVIESLGCVCQMWITDEADNHGCRGGTGAIKYGRRNMSEWIGMDSLQTIQGFVNVLKANHVITPFTEKFLGR